MNILTPGSALTALAALTGPIGTLAAQAPVPTRVLNIGEHVPGTPGATALDIHNFDTNAVGGFSIHVETDADQGAHLAWGSPDGGQGSPMCASGESVHLLEEEWRRFGHGMDDLGRIAHSSKLVGSLSESLWVGPEPRALQGTASPVPGYEWSAFEYVRITGGSSEPYFVGSLEGGPGTPDITGLFLGSPERALVLGGASIPGIDPPLANAPIHFGDFDVSDGGNHWIATARLLDNTSLVLVDGQPFTIEGRVVRSGAPLPPSFGPGVWGQLDDPHIDEAGNIVFLGRRKGVPDSMILRNGAIVHRSGDVIDGRVVLNFRKVHANESGRVTYLALLESNDYALGVEDRFLIQMHDAVDLQGDGTPDPFATVQGFGMPSLVSAPRLGDRGSVLLWLEVDVHGTPRDRTDDLAGVYRIDVRPGLMAGTEVAAQWDLRNPGALGGIGTSSAAHLLTRR